MLKLMYITNRPEVAQIAEAAGVDRIFVDMEFIGKDERQKGLDTVKSHHTPADIRAVKAAVKSAQVLARINPIHPAQPDYPDSAGEIEAALEAGADLLMLPYFKTPEEVAEFLSLVRGRAVTMLLVETPEAAARLEEILALPGIDQVHIGINDLSLGLGKGFMFELLADGTVEGLCLKLRQKGIPYGFGGIAALGGGALPAEYIIREHYRLGSGCAILSRSFCDTSKVSDLDQVRKTFLEGVRAIRALEAECETHAAYFWNSRRELERRVQWILDQKKGG